MLRTSATGDFAGSSEIAEDLPLASELELLFVLWATTATDADKMNKNKASFRIKFFPCAIRDRTAKPEFDVS
jgi:hypothetical protein